MNKVILTGRWSKDVELRYTPNGTAVANSSIAIQEGYGENKSTHFFDVVMWKKTAEAAAQYSGKGKRVAVEGRLQQRSWEKDGRKHYAIEVVAEHVEFLEARENSQMDRPSHDDTPPPVDDSDFPF